MIVWLIAIASMFIVQPSLSAFFWSKDYKKKLPQEVVEDLQKKQIDNPNDPHINYNLGVALYKTGDYQSARENFKRAMDHAKNDITLRKRSCYNLGNIGGQVSLNLLGSDWEKKKVDEKILEQALQEVKQAIEQYNNVLLLDPQDTNAQENKKSAELLAKKIQEKLAQQKADNKQQQGNDQKQDGSGKQDQSRNSEQEQTGREGQPQQQQGQDSQQPQQNKSEQEKQQGNQSPQAGSDDARQGQQNGRPEQQKGDSNAQKQQHKEQRAGEQKEEKTEQQQAEGEGKEHSQEQQSVDGRQAQETPQQEGQQQHVSGKDAKEGQQEKGALQKGYQGMPQANNKPEDSLEKRQAQAILDTLEQNEAQLQKELIFRNIHNRQQRQTTSQKPW